MAGGKLGLDVRPNGTLQIFINHEALNIFFTRRLTVTDLIGVSRKELTMNRKLLAIALLLAAAPAPAVARDNGPSWCATERGPSVFSWFRLPCAVLRR